MDATAASSRTSEKSDNPASTWRRRPIEWCRPGWDELVRSLPTVAALPIKNRVGMQHPFEADTVLNWPTGGLFSSRTRREWNGFSIGSGRITASPIQPREAAEALKRTLDANHFPTTEWWEAGISQLGEWWTLRACWEWPDKRPDSDGGTVCRVLWIEHDVRWSSIAIGGGLRREDGAIITATHEGAALTGPLITGMRPNRALTHAVWLRIERDARALADWRGRRVGAGMLNRWASEYLDYSWGPETGPRLLLRNGVSGRRDTDNGGGDQLRSVPDDLNQIAWQLGLSALCVSEVGERADLTGRIMRTVRRLDEVQNGLDPEGSSRTAPSGDTGRVH